MNEALWHRLDLFARSLFPFLITLMLAVLMALPLRLPGLSTIMPAFTLIAVYYWAVHRPQLMPIWAVFVIGLMQDLLSGGPVGVAIITLLCTQALIVWQRKIFASAPFALIWFIFMLAAAAAMTLMWILACIGLMAYLDPRPMVFQYLLTVAVYPFFAWAMVRGRRLFAS